MKRGNGMTGSESGRKEKVKKGRRKGREGRKTEMKARSNHANKPFMS